MEEKPKKEKKNEPVEEKLIDEGKKEKQENHGLKSEAKNESKNEGELKKKLVDYTDMLQRLQADFENFKKRTEKEKSEANKYASAPVIIKLLPVMDSFEMALKNKSSDPEKFAKGMELVYAQLYSVLKGEGLAKIDAVGQKFDPYVHEVLMQEQSEKDGIILEEFQKGYKFKDKILRHSKVKIGIV